MIRGIQMWSGVRFYKNVHVGVHGLDLDLGIEDNRLIRQLHARSSMSSSNILKGDYLCIGTSEIHRLDIWQSNAKNLSGIVSEDMTAIAWFFVLCVAISSAPVSELCSRWRLYLSWRMTIQGTCSYACSPADRPRYEEVCALRRGIGIPIFE